MKTFNPLQELERVYHTMKSAQINTKETFAWFSGIPHPHFNAIMHFSSEQNITVKVDTLISQAPPNTPLSFWIKNQNGSETLIEILKEKGFQLDNVYPLMAWSVKPISAPKQKIEPANLVDFYNILATTFHFDDVIKQGFAKLIENIKAEHYLAHLDDLPVGTGTLISNGKTGVIFNLATLPEYQKRGCGRAMMQHLMNRAFEQGLEKLVLLSSPVAEKLYLDLEFTKCFDLKIYIR